MAKNTIKLTIWRKENMYQGRKFNTYFTKCVIPTLQSDGTYKDEEKYLTVKFRSSVQVPYIRKKAIIEISKTEINIPYTYTIKVEKGKKVYPTIWIRSNPIDCKEVVETPKVNFVVEEEETDPYAIFDERD